ncbi:unnamed protein product [Candidula unifasciata]|uniref:C2H2-type domain-containing protein n=1 Tax=Candidula unifasciata TaxID=100452 RepID=A0A8S3Z6X7_9EUPU|nr:unnamed protein product [Candidula unifasciata]
MNVESEDVESKECLDVVNTKTSEEAHGIGGFNWNHVPSMPHPDHIVPSHLRKFLNKSCSPIQLGTTTASIPVPSEQGVHVRSNCCRTFTAKNNMKRHLRHHTGQRPYKCTSCLQSFFRRDDLKGHMIRHKYTKPFRCSRCQKGYTDRAYIKNHMAKEHGSRLMHVCPQCGESFDCEEAFACHKNTHPELKQFACTTCSFIGTSNLMVLKHRLLHTHKLFSCKPCNAYFADPFHYTSHVRKHKKMASFTQYVCCFCDMILGTYEQLVRHENSHAQCKIHACSICRKQFRSKILLRDHLMTHQQPAQVVTEHALPKTLDTEKPLSDSEQKYSLYKDVNMQQKPIDFTRKRSDYLVQESSPLAAQMENDEFYGQLLDLSMKKSPSLKPTNDSCNISYQNQIGSYNTSARATGTSVNDGSRNGTSSSDSARLSRECGLRRSGVCSTSNTEDCAA